MKTSPHFHELINQIRKGKVIFWVGSGFSKTSGFLLGSELVELIKRNVNESDVSIFNTKFNLDDVSEEFVQIYSRKKLEHILIDAFGKIPEDLQYQKQIVKIPQITTIITTNYDTCFELAYGDRLCTIISDADIVKSTKAQKVNLYKIHGDVNNPQKIVITKSDYANFYKKQSENLVWNEIRSLITKNSILFIGYSFEDSNVKLIFDDILERLGKDHCDFFLISPSIAQYKQAYLEKEYSIKYIEMKIEKAIPKIGRAIEKSFYHDIQKGYIKSPFLNLALKERKSDPTFSCNPDGTLNITSIKGDVKIQCQIRYSLPKENSREITELQDVLEGKSFEAITLSSSKGKLQWTTKIGSSDLFKTKRGKKSEIILKRNPIKSIKADLGLKGSDQSLECCSGEHYASPYAFQFDLHYVGFDIILNGDKTGYKKFSMKFHPSTVNQGYKLFKFLNDWMNGKDLQIYLEIPPSPLSIPFNSIEINQKMRDQLKRDYTLFSSLFKIQQKCCVMFNILIPISREDCDDIIAFAKILDGEKVQIDPIKCTMKLINYDMFLKTLEDPSEPVTINFPEISYTFFDKVVSLKNCSVEIMDMVYLNKEEIKLQMQEKREVFNVCMGSKTNQIFIMQNTINPYPEQKKKKNYSTGTNFVP